MLASNTTLLRYYHPLFHVWRSLGLRYKNGPKNASMGYILSVIPALWAFFAMGRGPTSDTVSLIVGFIAVLLIDRHFYLLKLTPLWWMKLRIPLTLLVTSLLGIGLII